jgi:hypothetical protein
LISDAGSVLGGPARRPMPGEGLDLARPAGTLHTIRLYLSLVQYIHTDPQFRPHCAALACNVWPPLRFVVVWCRYSARRGTVMGLRFSREGVTRWSRCGRCCLAGSPRPCRGMRRPSRSSPGFNPWGSLSVGAGIRLWGDQIRCGQTSTYFHSLTRISSDSMWCCPMLHCVWCITS